MKKIMVIEDDPVTARIYGSAYEIAGFEVLAVGDGDAGLNALATFEPDLIQLDLMLPRSNGVEVLKKIRSHPRFASVPVIVLSNSYVSDFIKSAWKAGANKCVAKMSGSPNVMLEIITDIFKQAKFAAKPAPSTQQATAASSHPDATIEFLNRLPDFRAKFRAQMHEIIKNKELDAQLDGLHQVHLSAYSLAGQAGSTGFIRIAQMASALEALVRELHLKPKQITPSALRTVAQAVDCVDLLFSETPRSRGEAFKSALVLAVDDEPISRQILCSALSKANLKTVNLDDPDLALSVLKSNPFDLIFLDVEMPKMDGFELCRRLRALPTNKKTPVIFVTSLTDFATRARSTLIGGNDLIAKPFLLIELAVKALIFLARNKPQKDSELDPPQSTKGRFVNIVAF